MLLDAKVYYHTLVSVFENEIGFASRCVKKLFPWQLPTNVHFWSLNDKCIQSKRSFFCFVSFHIRMMSSAHNLSRRTYEFQPPAKRRKTLSTNNLLHHDNESTGSEEESKDRIPPFLSKLWNILNDPSTHHIISWHKVHHNAFTVHHQDRFCSEILPRYFKHCKFNSFVRQLNLYQCYVLSDCYVFCWLLCRCTLCISLALCPLIDLTLSLSLTVPFKQSTNCVTRNDPRGSTWISTERNAVNCCWFNVKSPRTTGASTIPVHRWRRRPQSVISRNWWWRTRTRSICYGMRYGIFAMKSTANWIRCGKISWKRSICCSPSNTLSRRCKTVLSQQCIRFRHLPIGSIRASRGCLSGEHRVDIHP